MYPYRRNGPKKRGKGGHGRPNRGDGGRRVPGSAGELLSQLQPTTKALAQMLAGNTKTSGQLVHARNVLAQAQRHIDERSIDRLPPAHREEFLEQLARLKLTLADADELIVDDGDEVARPASRIEPDRLRDVARRLAESEAPPPPPVAAPAPFFPDDHEVAPAPTRRQAVANGNTDRGRLRLSSASSDPEREGRTDGGDSGGTATARRPGERLRLKSVTGPSSEG